MARRTPHHAERPQDRRVPLTPQFGEPPPSESPGSRVPPQAISGSAADSMSRGRYPLPGRTSSKALPPTKAHPSPPEGTSRQPRHNTRAPTKAPGAGYLRSAISGSEADSMSRGRHPAHGALSIEGTLPFIGAPPSPKPTGFRTNPMGTFPPCGKPVGPAKSPSAPLPHDHRPKAAVKGRATTRRQPWPIPSSNESGNTPSTHA